MFNRFSSFHIVKSICISVFLHITDYLGMIIITAIMYFFHTWLYLPIQLVLAEYLPEERYTLISQTFLFINFPFSGWFSLLKICLRFWNIYVYSREFMLIDWSNRRLDSRCDTELHYLLSFTHHSNGIMCCSMDNRNHLSSNLSTKNR